MDNQVIEAEKKLDKMVSQKTLTNDGRDWLVCALDPFHDLDHPMAGYPDADSSSTVVGCYQYALDFGKDAAQTSATWDAHVFVNPISLTTGDDEYFKAASTSADGSVVTAAADGSVALGMVSVYKNNSGEPLFPTAAADITATVSTTNVDLGSEIFAGNTRIIAMGIEIVDTTAEIYKQGALTAYRMNQRPIESSTKLWVDAALATGKAAVCTEYRMQAPPSTVAQATLLAGTRQWECRKGCYSIVTQSSIENPIQYPSSSMITMSAFNAASDTASFCMSTGGTAWSASVLPSISFNTTLRHCKFPINTTGIMLTGLNAASTFRLKLKIFVEAAPQFSLSSLSVLATPSAPYDPSALEAYSKAVSKLPVSVQVNANAMGDWFSTIGGVLSAIALPVSKALSPIVPGASLIRDALESHNRTVGQKKNDLLGSDVPDMMLSKQNRYKKKSKNNKRGKPQAR